MYVTLQGRRISKPLHVQETHTLSASQKQWPLKGSLSVGAAQRFSPSFAFKHHFSILLCWTQSLVNLQRSYGYTATLILLQEERLEEAYDVFHSYFSGYNSMDRYSSIFS